MLDFIEKLATNGLFVLVLVSLADSQLLYGRTFSLLLRKNDILHTLYKISLVFFLSKDKLNLILDTGQLDTCDNYCSVIYLRVF